MWLKLWNTSYVPPYIFFTPTVNSYGHVGRSVHLHLLVASLVLCYTDKSYIFHRVELDTSISSLVLVNFVTKTLLSCCVIVIMLILTNGVVKAVE